MEETKEKRAAPSFLQKVLDYDVIFSKKFVDYALQFGSFRSIKTYGTYLDLSCNGIVWFPMWIALFWILNNKNLHGMQMNMLIGLVIDVITVAVLKAFIRRRRPAVDTSLLSIGPDKFSFPSGHTSRAYFIFLFFTTLWPLSKFFWLPLLAWSSCVAVSRLLLRRHYLLDVCCGIMLSGIVACLLSLVWIDNETATNFINYLSSDNLPDAGVGDD